MKPMNAPSVPEPNSQLLELEQKIESIRSENRQLAEKISQVELQQEEACTAAQQQQTILQQYIHHLVELTEESLQQKQELLILADKLDQLGRNNSPAQAPAASPYVQETYSQSGEDSIILYILQMLNISIGDATYVDLGANHAKFLSNTYALYSRGAAGILVEANPSLIPELESERTRDLILNRCVDVQSGRIQDFYILNSDGLCTTSYESAMEFCEKNPYLSIVDHIKVPTISYNDLVNQYLHAPPALLSIDLEGKDMEILQSIDFETKRPVIIVIEMIDYEIRLAHRTKNETIVRFMDQQGYDEYAFTGINSIFVDRDRLRLR
ncbi:MULTISPECIES: FkbM family methyltransferase [Paenibacillus]|uniref:FkbM family methyltransferase n=1 Tax=Paenibacillus TaxID=44249 RepID=UPI0006769F3C|nr:MULTISPECIES: FkbM family methyltransferase [Paenibacillus]